MTKSSITISSSLKAELHFFLLVCCFFLPSFNIYVEGLVGVVCGEKIDNPGYFVAVRGWELFLSSMYKGFCTMIHRKMNL